MKRTSLAIGIAMSTLVSSAAHAGCVEDSGPTATVRRLRADGEDYLPGHRTTVGNVTIGPRGEVTLTTNPQSKPGDVEILNERLRSMGIRRN